MSTDPRILLASQKAAEERKAVEDWKKSHPPTLTADIFSAWLAHQTDASLFDAYARGVYLSVPVAAAVIPPAYKPTTDRNRAKILLHDVVYIPASVASVSLGSNPVFYAQLRAKLIDLGYYDNVNQLDAARQSSGGLFGGLFDSITAAFKPIVRASLQVSTLGHADQVIHASQTVVRNPIVQAMAVSALTVYTGGAAAGLLGGGVAGTVGGSVIANAAISKATDRTFNLQNALIQGATAGAGAYIKDAKLVADTAMNGAAQAALTKAISDKAAGRAFNLQEVAIAGAAKFSYPVGGLNLTVGELVTGAKQVNDLKTAYTNFEDSKAKAREQVAIMAQNTAQINAGAAANAAAQAELNALQLALQNAHAQPVAQAQTAQHVAPVSEPKVTLATAEKVWGLGILGALALIVI